MEHGGGARFARLGGGARFARLGGEPSENLQRTQENLQRTFREPSENLFFTFLVAGNLQRTHAGTREPGSGNFAGRTRAADRQQFISGK